MDEKTVNVELTQDEMNQIASGNVPVRLRKRFGYEGSVVTVTETYDFVISEDEPLSFWGYVDDDRGSFKVSVKNLEDFRDAFENHREDLLQVIENWRYQKNLGHGRHPDSAKTITCDDVVFEVKP